MYYIGMFRRLWYIPLLLIFLMSCESELYPPTYAPVLSNLVMTTSSFRTQTTTGYENDTVFFTLDVDDSEDDPYTLDLSILSAGVEVQAEEFSESRIIDGSYWEGWFDSTGQVPGAYTLNFTATDKEGNISALFTGNYTIIADARTPVTAADVAFTYVSYLPPDDPLNTDGIAMVTYTVQNNSAVTIDQVKVVFPVTVDATLYSETGSVTGLAAGAVQTGTIKYPIYSSSTPLPVPVDGDASLSITFY